MENERLLSVAEAVVATDNDELYNYWESIEPVLKAQRDITANYYETVIIPERIETAVNNALIKFQETLDKEIIPQKIKEAEKSLLEEIENQLLPEYLDSYKMLGMWMPDSYWQQLKKSRGIA